MIKLEDCQLFDLKTEKLPNKRKFFYLTYKGQGIYYKTPLPTLSRIRLNKGIYLAPQRHTDPNFLRVCLAKGLDFPTEIRNYKGDLIL